MRSGFDLSPIGALLSGQLSPGLRSAPRIPHFLRHGFALSLSRRSTSAPPCATPSARRRPVAARPQSRRRSICSSASRRIEGLAPDEQPQAQCLAGVPACQQVVRIGREEEVMVLGRKDRAGIHRVAVRPGDTDEQADTSPVQRGGERLERVGLFGHGRRDGRTCRRNAAAARPTQDLSAPDRLAGSASTRSIRLKYSSSSSTRIDPATPAAARTARSASSRVKAMPDSTRVVTQRAAESAAQRRRVGARARLRRRCGPAKPRARRCFSVGDAASLRRTKAGSRRTTRSLALVLAFEGTPPA